MTDESLARPLHPDVAKFFAAIAGWQDAYASHSTFSFLGLRDADRLVILRGRVRLSSRPRVPREPLNLSSLQFAEIPINGTATAIIALVEAILTGNPFELGTYFPMFLLPAKGVGSAYHEHPTSTSVRAPFVERLVLQGESRWLYMYNKLHALEKEALNAGFESMDDLLQTYEFAPMGTTDSLDVELVAEPIVEIDTASTVRERSVDLVVNLPGELSAQNLLITVLGDDAGPQLRHRISGTQLAWTKSDERKQGRFALELDRPAIIKCRAIYGGALHDIRQLLDGRAPPNLRRRVLEITDPGLANLTQLLLSPRRDQARDFEAAVSALLYLLGFDSAPLAGITKDSNAADVVALVGEDVLIVECSVLVLDPKDKLSKLIHRLEHAKSELRDRQATMRIRGVLATPLPDDKVENMRRMAAENDLILLTRTELAERLEYSRCVPQAVETLARWSQQSLDIAKT